MNDNNDDGIYKVVARGDRFEVLNDTARVIVTCRDERSAGEYAVLLNQAYGRGFKDGHRKARKGLPRP
jgi:hypothetical protein